MNVKKRSLLTKQEQSTLNDALFYMKINELKKACKLLGLAETGKKIDLINQIMMFIRTGEKTEPRKISGQSLAKNYPHQTISPNALMLYGRYKNDLKTRNFFKDLIGQHFHFTAFGIDWLNDRWHEGTPPTYKEFADYWVKEAAARKQKKASPKPEWAYIRFLQNKGKTHPDASKAYLIQAWKDLQAQKAQTAFNLLRKAVEMNKGLFHKQF